MNNRIYGSSKIFILNLKILREKKVREKGAWFLMHNFDQYIFVVLKSKQNSIQKWGGELKIYLYVSSGVGADIPFIGPIKH